MLVHLVGEDVEVVFHRDCGEVGQLGARVDGAGRVGRRVQDEQAGARRDRGLELRWREFETRAVVAEHDLRHGPGEFHHFRVADPEGRRHDDLVARRAHGQDSEVAGELAARGDDDLGRGDGEIILRRIERDDRLAQGFHPGRGTVFSPAGLQGGRAGVLDVRRRVEVRFTGGKTADVLTSGLQGLGLRVDGERGRRRDGAGPSGKWRGSQAHRQRAANQRGPFLKCKPGGPWWT